MPKLYPLPGPVARSLEVVGDRWTLLVVRELLLGGRRWAELERALPGIPSNLLAERLRLLEEEGVVERAAEGRVYHLTDKGRDLAPVLASLAELLASFVEAGGQVWGCSACTTPRGITEADLVEGSQIVGAATIVAAVAEGAVPVALG